MPKLQLSENDSWKKKKDNGKATKPKKRKKIKSWNLKD